MVVKMVPVHPSLAFIVENWAIWLETAEVGNLDPTFLDKFQTELQDLFGIKDPHLLTISRGNKLSAHKGRILTNSRGNQLFDPKGNTEVMKTIGT